MKHQVFVLVILPLALLGTIWLNTPLIEHNDGFDSDGIHYASMALRDPRLAELAHTAPWCWRVLTPWLVSLMPGSSPADVLRDFKWLALLSNWATLVLLYGLLRASGFVRSTCAVGVLLYAGVFWTIKFSFYSPSYIDAQTQLLLVAVLYLMVTHRYWALPVVLTLGVLQKESLLFLVPVVWVYYWHTQRGLKAADCLCLALTLVLPACALVAVRSMSEAVNDYSGLATLALLLRAQLSEPAFWPRMLLAVFSGLGLLPLIVLRDRRVAWQYLRRNPHWLTLLVLGLALLFGGVDKARLFLPLAPVCVVLAAHVLEHRLGEGERRGVAWLGVTLLLHFYLGHHLTPMGSFTDYLNQMVPLHAPGPLTASFVRVGLVSVLWAATTWLLQRPRHRPANPFAEGRE